MRRGLFAVSPQLGAFADPRESARAKLVGAQAGVGVGDVVQLISPQGAQTAFGTTPRIATYEVVYIFTAGRYDIDRTRIYMPLPAAQDYFNRAGAADEMQVYVADPEQVEQITPALMQALPAGVSTPEIKIEAPEGEALSAPAPQPVRPAPSETGGGAVAARITELPGSRRRPRMPKSGLRGESFTYLLPSPWLGSARPPSGSDV